MTWQTKYGVPEPTEFKDLKKLHDSFNSNIKTRQLVIGGLIKLFLEIDGMKRIDKFGQGAMSFLYWSSDLEKNYSISVTFNEKGYSGEGTIYIRGTAEGVRDGTVDEVFPGKIKNDIALHIMKKFPDWKYEDIEEKCIFKDVTSTAILKEYGLNGSNPQKSI